MQFRGREFRSWWMVVVLAAFVLSAPIVAADQQARVLAGNTLRLSGCVASASVLLGVPLAFLLARCDLAGRRVYVLGLLALMFMPLYLQAGAWKAAFDEQGWFTMASGWPPLMSAWRGAIAIHTLAAIPWVVVIAGVGLRGVEAELEEQSLLDASAWNVFWRVTLPRSAASVAAAFLWVAIAVAGEMTVTDLFQVRTYAEQIYTEFALGDRLDAQPWHFASGAVGMTWIVAAALVLVARLLSADRHASQRRSHIFRLGVWRWPASALVGAVAAALVAVPVGSFVAKAGVIVTHEGSTWTRAWSIGRAAEVVMACPERYAREIGWTALVGIAAATSAVALGLPLAWIARSGGWRAAPTWIVVAVALAVPGPLVGLGLIEVFSVADWQWLAWLYDRSIAPLWLAQTFRALPLCTLVLWYALRAVPRELLESAELDGASPWIQFLFVALPQCTAAAAGAWWVALALAWGELSASILVVPPGVMTLPIQIFGLIHYGVDDQVAGISLVVFSAFFALAFVVQRLARRMRQDV